MTNIRPVARTARHLAVGVAFLASASALSGCVISIGGNDAKFRETRQYAVEAALASSAETSPLVVNTANGSVDVERATGDVHVTAHLKARTQERLDATEVITERRPDGALHVYVDWADGRRYSNEGCSFEITTTGVESLDIDTKNGAIRITDLSGPALLRTSNGAIVARHHQGAIDASTSNGAINVYGALADVSARTSNGAITIEEAAGAVHADTSNGGITVRLADDSPGPVVADSSNGSITLELGPAFNGELRLDTSGGRVTVDGAPMARIMSLNKSSAKLVVGDGDAVSKADTSNGNVRVRFRGG